MQFHPDRNKEPGAEDRFKEISQAYAVLSGKEKPQPEIRYTSSGFDGGDSEARSWSDRVMRVWMAMENEKNNNMYR